MQRADPAAIARGIRAAQGRTPLLLLCDFDGTLCEFQAYPAPVRLPASRAALLERIARQAATTIGVVSGRRLSDVRARTRLDPSGKFFAGLHGLEIEGAGERFLHPGIGDVRSHVLRLAAALAPHFAPLPGAFIEDKGLSIVVHFREASPADRATIAARFEQEAAPEVAAGHLRVMHGASMLEVLPNLDWNKGHAVEWIRDRVTPPPFTVYLGDDVTDEDAFRATKGHGISIAASDRVSGADYFVDGPPAVEQILAVLATDTRATDEHGVRRI
jgi:trehalose-phosphatase